MWSPHRVMCIEDIDRVQMKATKLVLNIQKLSYSERLKRLELPAMKYRRLSCDIIGTFKWYIDFMISLTFLHFKFLHKRFT